MKEVTITNANSMCYKLLTDTKGNRYLMDVSTVSNKLYCFGVQSDKVTVDMIKIDKNDTRFEQKNLQSSTFVAITAGSQLFANIDTDTYMGEIKFENVINRVDGSANPRQIERVPAGTIFAFKVAYNIENEAEVTEDMKILQEGLALLGIDYLGGHGSRSCKYFY